MASNGYRLINNFFFKKFISRNLTFKWQVTYNFAIFDRFILGYTQVILAETDWLSLRQAPINLISASVIFRNYATMMSQLCIISDIHGQNCADSRPIPPVAAIKRGRNISSSTCIIHSM